MNDLFKITEDIVEELSTNHMSLIMGGTSRDNFVTINAGSLCHSINNSANCDLINQGNTCALINQTNNCSEINVKKKCKEISD